VESEAEEVRALSELAVGLGQAALGEERHDR